MVLSSKTISDDIDNTTIGENHVPAEFVNDDEPEPELQALVDQKPSRKE